MKKNLKIKQAVIKAKSLLKKRSDLKYEIVKIAIEVCDFTIGGHSGKHDYTTSHFAKDIGINPNTMLRWRREYELVISKVNKADVVRKALEGTLKQVKKDTPADIVNKIYEIELKKGKTPDDARLLDCLKRISTIKFLICHKFVLKKMDKETLANVRTMCLEIVSAIDGKNLSIHSRKQMALDRINEL